MNKDRIFDIIRLVLTYTVVIGSVAGVSFWLWRNPIYNPAGPRIQEAKSQIEVRFRNAVVKGRKNGTPYWTVFCKNVESARESSKVFFRDKPYGEFYNIKDWSKETGNNMIPVNPSPSPPQERLRTFNWDSDEAEYDTETEDLTLRKNVKVVTDDKDIIKTDELQWKNSQQKAISNKRTTITGHEGHPIIKADSLEAETKMDVLNLKGNVEIITELTEDQKL
jgi:lipopolysaccharide export system protein LptC